jgi:hypothetical protein
VKSKNMSKSSIFERRVQRSSLSVNEFVNGHASQTVADE